jgi:hypothetical protein
LELVRHDVRYDPILPVICRRCPEFCMTSMATDTAWMLRPLLPSKRETSPDWWPYARELPRWHVWRGVNDVFYASRRMTSPPIVVRGEDAEDLRKSIKREQARLSERWGRAMS